MALKDIAAQTTPAFESEVDSEIAEPTVQATLTDQRAEAVAKATEAFEQVTPPAAIFIPKAPAVIAPKRAVRFQPAFSHLEWVLTEEQVSELAVSTPRIKAEQGEAYLKDKALGKSIRMDVVSWNKRYLISTGLSSNDGGYAESLGFLRTSYDGATIFGEGTTISDYLAELKNLGYRNAKVSPYVDLFGFVTEPDLGTDLYLVQLSQTSAGNFNAFCTTTGLLVSRGTVTLDPESPSIIVSAKAQSKGTMKYSNFEFSLPK
jgi:hypothetical protein